MADFIAHMEGVSTAGSSINVGRVSAAAADIAVPHHIKKLLDRAGIQPPALGATLTPALVSERVKAAKLSTDESMALKRALVTMKLLLEGSPFSL